MPPLAPMPPTVATRGGRLRGLWAGSLREDPVSSGPTRGRVRRWMYAAAGDEHAAVGAAVVDLGFASTAFAWAWDGTEVVSWDAKRPARLGATVSTTPDGGAEWRGRERLRIGGDGSLDLDVALAGGRRLQASTTASETSPATLATGTAAGGWNCTEKAAGYDTTGEVTVDGRRLTIDGGGWRDWTSGRQDRATSWRWAAGAGRATDGRAVGLNTSTGMNGEADGEDVVWWDGVPYPLDVTTLAPEGASDGTWQVSGPGWGLRLEPVGVRAADEDLLLVASRYTQPIGQLIGTLPDPDGRAVEVRLTGVTEDHEARW